MAWRSEGARRFGRVVRLSLAVKIVAAAGAAVVLAHYLGGF